MQEKNVVERRTQEVHRADSSSVEHNIDHQDKSKVDSEH